MIINCFLPSLSMTERVAQRMFTAPDTKPHSSLNGENLSRNFKYCWGCYQGSEPKSSKIQIMSTKGICCQVFIDTVNQPLLTLSRLTSQLTLDWHLILFLVTTRPACWPTLDWQSTDSYALIDNTQWQLTVDWDVEQDWCWLSSNRDVNWFSIKILIKCWLRCQSRDDRDVNQGLIKGINWCLTTVAFHTHHPKILVNNLWKLSSRTFWILARILKGFSKILFKDVIKCHLHTLNMSQIFTLLCKHLR